MIPYSRHLGTNLQNVVRRNLTRRNPSRLLNSLFHDGKNDINQFHRLEARRYLHSSLARFEKKVEEKETGAASSSATKEESTSAGAKINNDDKAKADKKEDGKEGEGKEGATGKPDDNYWLQAGVVAGILAFLAMQGVNDKNYNEVSMQEMLNDYLAKGHIDSITVVNRTFARVNLRKDSPHKTKVFQFEIGNIDQFEHKIEAYQMRLGIQPEDFISIQYSTERDTTDDLVRFLPTAILLISLFFLGRAASQAGDIASQIGAGPQGGMGGQGRNIFNLGRAVGARKDQDLKSKVKFADVAGLKQPKVEIIEFVDFLKAPKKYNDLGARIPKGGLLVGPPGTGKTLLAKAVAGEADVPFYSMSGSDFIEMFVGVGPSRVRDLFEQARKTAPSIVFIDEIDAVGRKRGKGGFNGGGNDERENTLNQLLVEMDGFTEMTNVVVLAGTNRADILDPALTRPGRFDRTIYIGKPDLSERDAIFQIYLKKLKLETGLDMEETSKRLASLTPGFVGADINNICNESAIYAARRSSDDGVAMSDFEAATERTIGGLPKENSLMSQRQKEIIALHEGGHALCGWLQEFTDPLVKVSIVPRSNGALGFAQYLPEEMALQSKQALLNRMVVTLGGRAAEELFTGQISTGASDDLDKVTQMGYSMVGQLGMSEKVGLISFNPERTEQSFTKPFSEATSQLIDAEVQLLVAQQYEKAKEILLANETLLRALADKLAEKETLVFSDLLEVLGPRPFAINSAYAKYAQAAPEIKKIPTESKEETKADVEEPVATNIPQPQLGFVDEKVQK